MRTIPLLLTLALTVGCGDKPDDTGHADDVDGDGYGASVDCDDEDADVNPGASEVPYDGVDNDCDEGTPDDDVDGDGYGVADDCDDDNAEVHPDAEETCNEIDDDCDEEVDEDAVDADTWYPDDDGDSYGDGTATDTVAACEQPGGYVADATDCDDALADVHPGADETCNGLDDDCDDETDEDPVDGTNWYLDYDGDGQGSDDYVLEACEQPSGYVDNADDCDDLEATTYLGADEIPCNDVDDDCDGEADELGKGVSVTWYLDSDGDGWGDDHITVEEHPDCAGPSGYVDMGDDCDDGDAKINPGAEESCDEVDNDCDGAIDEGDAVDAEDWYPDDDGDGYGWFQGPAAASCEQPTGYVADSTDCDDDDASVNPSVADSCIWAEIQEIQTGTFADGDIVTVVGWSMHDATSTGFFMMDADGAYNGIWVYAPGTSALEGDELVLWGEVLEYNDLTEIYVTAPSTDITVLSTGNVLPSATVVTTAELADPKTAEPYEGCLVTVESVTVGDSDLGYGEWSVDDDVRVDDAIYAFEGDLAVDGTFTSITGLLNYSYGNYKIEPRYDLDFAGYVSPVCTADLCADDLVVGDLVITEVLANPDYCDDADCEWFEIYNASGQTVDLDGVVLEDADGDSATISDCADMAAGSYMVVARGASSTWGYIGFTPDAYYGSSVALGNSGDQVLISNSLGTLDETPVYTSGDASPGESWSLDPTAMDVTINDDAAYWCAAASTIAGTKDLGTPGASNDSCF